MYAVIRAGGKQHKVQAGDVIEVELMRGVGETVTFQPLLVVDDEGKTHVGKEVAKAVVTARPAGEQKGDKVRVFKYKAKTGYSRKAGHRQLMTLLEIADVNLGGSAAGRSSSSSRTSAKASGSTRTSGSSKASAPAGSGSTRKRSTSTSADVSEDAEATDADGATE
jgi:large subunit ribosomal protein L21